MAVTVLPVGTEPVGDQTQGTRTQIGKGFVGQEQEPAIIDYQGQMTASLFLTPANPAVAPAQAAGGRAKNQHPEPLAAGVGHGVKKLLADGADPAQIVMLTQQPLQAGFVVPTIQQTRLDSDQRG